MTRFLMTLLFVLPFSLKSQSFEAGILGGLSFYSGDLSPREFGLFIQDSNIAFGAFGRVNFNSPFSVRLNAILSSLSGDDVITVNKGRDLNFQSSLTEVALLVEWNLIRLGSSRYGGIYPYLFTGVGGFHFNPESKLEDKYIELQPLGTEGQGLPGYEAPYDRFSYNIPFGAGIKVEIENFGTIGLEIGVRKLFTDYIDDVSGTVINYRELVEGNGELAARFSNKNLDPTDPVDETYTRGSPYQDWYHMINCTFSFNLGSIDHYKIPGNGLGCPRF